MLFSWSGLNITFVEPRRYFDATGVNVNDRDGDLAGDDGFAGHYGCW